MISTIGGGTPTSPCNLARRIVYSKAVRVARNEMDEAIIQYVKKPVQLLIGERTASRSRSRSGSAFPSRSG